MKVKKKKTAKRKYYGPKLPQSLAREVKAVLKKARDYKASKAKFFKKIK